MPQCDDCQQPGIKDYAIIGDCRTAALISSAGSIDWLCLPHFSSSSVFARLLDPRGGHFSIRPRSDFVTKRRYLPNSAVLETVFETETGVARLVDLCPIVDGLGTLEPMREVLRIIEGIKGCVDLEIDFAPRPDYGRAKPELRRVADGVWRCGWNEALLLLHTRLRLVECGTFLRGAARLTGGTREHVSLAYVDRDIGTIASLGAEADARCARTIGWWRDWSKTCKFDGPEREVVLRSAITLKLLTFCLSGAVVAAPTTSIPETIGGGRNWDYRYCWLRDAGLTMNAFLGLGFHQEASMYLGWLLHATRLSRPKLSILYDVYGRTNLREWQLSWLAGHRNSSPVRVGNNAVRQFQLDVYGEVIAAAQSYAASGHELEPAEVRMLAGFGKIICTQWREPDNGIWEIPGRRRSYTFSKVMCWVALDKLLWLHEKGIVCLGSHQERFRKTREDIAECVEREGFDPELGSYTGELGGKEVDAASLLMPLFGYREFSDARMVSTYRRIQGELGSHGLLYRYPEGYDGLPGRQGAFGICSFFAVSHLAMRGLIREAQCRIEHLCSFGNDVGLFAEEIEPESAEALGNYPQAFTHAGLIYSALSLQRARAGGQR